MRKLLALVAFVVVFTNMEVKSTPSTQIWIPSTDIQGFLKPHIGWDAYVNAYDNWLTSNGGLTIGILPPKVIVGLEAGIDYRDGIVSPGVHKDPVLFNAKLGLPEDAFFKYMPAFAIGAYDIGTKDSVNNFNVTYGLLAKTISKLGRLSVGGYYGAGPENLWTSSSKHGAKVDNAGVLVSWDRVISEVSDKLWLAVDYQSGYNWYGALSFGAAYNFAPNVGVIFGYDIYNDEGLSKPTFTFQVDINAF